MQEFDSIAEIVFWISNIGVVPLSIIFYFIVQNRLVKFSLMLGMLGFHFIIFPIIFFACKVTVFDEAFCREGWWLFVLIPPVQFFIGILSLVVLQLMQRNRRARNKLM
jgi:EamA domain-containing membrane protein RarD